MKYKVGFIGCGNMASAIIGGLKAHAGIDASEIIAADASEAAREKAKETLSICTTASNTEVSTQADVLFLSVKPQYYETVIAEIQPTLPAGQIIVTIAPGKTLAWLGERLGDVKIVRTMPNTPALVGEGITGVCKNNLVTEDEFAYVLKLLSSFGLAEAIPESLMDAVVSVSGSSPAYVFLFIEAMADAAVADGQRVKKRLRPRRAVASQHGLSGGGVVVAAAIKAGVRQVAPSVARAGKDSAFEVFSLIGNDTACQCQNIDRCIERGIDISGSRFRQPELRRDKQCKDCHHNIEAKTLSHISQSGSNQTIRVLAKHKNKFL